MYRVVEDFKDLRDAGYAYKKGDVYPHKGTADPDRAKHLMTPTDQRGPLIEEAEEPKPKPEPKPEPKAKRKKKED